MNRRSFQHQFPDLRPVLDPLPWGVVGAAAARLYMPERVTHDLDVLIRGADAEDARRLMAAAGFHPEGALTIGGSAWTTPDGFDVDVIECSDPWCDTALREARDNRDVTGAPIVPLPYLVLLKFRASRVQDLADLTRMLGLATPEQNLEVRRVLERWSPADLEDFESLTNLGRLELDANAGDEA